MSAKSRPVSLRLDSTLDELITSEARRTKRSKGAVMESLLDEAMRLRRFSGIAFRGEDFDRRCWVIGTALDVWEIIEAYRDLGSTERFLAESDLTERHLRVALAYAEEYPEEIDALIAENRRPLEDLRRQYPTIDVLGLS